jgi:hypothetical protein
MHLFWLCKCAAFEIIHIVTRFTRLILKHSKKLLPFQRDLRGETPLEICATHGDHESIGALLQYSKVCLSNGALASYLYNLYKEHPHFDVQNIDFRTSMAKVVILYKLHLLSN